MPTSNQASAYSQYRAAGLSPAGAAAMVARGSLESGGGRDLNPNSVNSIGAIGIAQDLGSRQNGVVIGDLNNQVQHNITELQTGSDGSGGYAYRALQSDDPYTAATGASAFERAENYNPSTHTDVLTDKTANLMGNLDFSGVQTGSSIGSNGFTNGQQSLAQPGFAPLETVGGSSDGYMTVKDYVGNDPNGGSGNSMVNTGTGGMGTTGPQSDAAMGNGEWKGGGSNSITPSTQSGAGFSSGAASGSDSSGTAQQGIPSDTPTAIVTGDNQLAKQSKTNQDSANKTSTANTKSATQTATGIYTWAQAALGDTVFRIAMVVIGLVVLAGALYMIAEEQGAAPSIKTVVKRVGKAATLAV